MHYESPFDEKLKPKSYDDLDYQVLQCLEYTPEFDLKKFDPQPGDLFQVFVEQQYLTYELETVRQHKVFGSYYYAPESDIPAMIFHSGILFIHAKLKAFPHRRFSTVQNVYEVMAMNETDYARKAVVLDLPTDLQIQGVLVNIYIDKSPDSFIAATHNAYQSQSLPHAAEYSMRFTEFSIVTMYDVVPAIVPDSEYRKARAVIPNFDITFTGEVGIKFEPMMFVQIFSRYNVSSGMFDVFRLFFDVDKDRFEICWRGGTRFSVVKYIEQISVEVVRHKNVPSDKGVVVEDADMCEFSVTRGAIIVKAKRFEPVSSLVLVQCSRRAPAPIPKPDIEK